MPQNILHIVYLRLPVIIHPQSPGSPTCFDGYYDVRPFGKVSYSLRDFARFAVCRRAAGSAAPKSASPTPERQLTHFAATSTVKASHYEHKRVENPGWPTLEERRYRRHLPGHALVLRGPEYHGYPAKVRGGRRDADPCAGRAGGRRPEDSGVLSRAGRRKVLGLRSTELPCLQHLRPSSALSAGKARRNSRRSSGRSAAPTDSSPFRACR